MSTDTLALVGSSFEIQLGPDTTNVSLSVRGTFAGFNCIFEGQVEDGGTWFPTDAVRSVGATVESVTGVLSAAPAYSWDVSVGGYRRLRMRCTARTSGTQVWDYNSYRGGPECAPVSVVSSISAALPAGTSKIGDTGAQITANATGAGLIAKVLSAASTNATVVKASAGRLYGFQLANTSAAWKYLKLHNVAVAPTPGAAVAATIAIPPGGHVSVGFDVGMGFATGIGYTITNLSPENDTTVVAVGDVVGHLVFG